MTEKTVEHLEKGGLHVSIKAEPIFKVLGFDVTNSLFLSFIMLLVFIGIVIAYRVELKKTNRSSFFYFVQFALRSMYGFFESALGDKINVFFPLVGAFFFYILLQNWSGLLPGVGSILYHEFPLFRANTSDLNTTLALAIVSVVSIQFFGLKYLGVKGYLGKFINFSNPISFFVGILEIISELSRIVSFAFRLFGNIFAGEVLLTVVAFLVPVLVSFPFLMLETLVGLIQAVVFSMLTSVLLNLATTEHH